MAVKTEREREREREQERERERMIKDLCQKWKAKLIFRGA